MGLFSGSGSGRDGADARCQCLVFVPGVCARLQPGSSACAMALTDRLHQDLVQTFQTGSKRHLAASSGLVGHSRFCSGSLSTQASAIWPRKSTR